LLIFVTEEEILLAIMFLPLMDMLVVDMKVKVYGGNIEESLSVQTVGMPSLYVF
jgi:hypothetical protein